MLLKLTDTEVINKCYCKRIIKHSLSELNCEYLEEFQAFSNVNLKCKECGTIEIVNMNLDSDENLKGIEIPEEELNARAIALELKRRMEQNNCLIDKEEKEDLDE